MKNNKKKAQEVYDSLENVDNKRKQYFYQMMCFNGLTPTEATRTYCNLQKCKWSTIERLWRENCTEEEKGREQEAEFKLEFSGEGKYPEKDFTYLRH